MCPGRPLKVAWVGVGPCRDGRACRVARAGGCRHDAGRAYGVAVSSHWCLLESPRTGILHLASSRVFGISIPLDRPCSRRPRQRLSLRFFCHLAYSDLLCRSGTHSAQEPSLPLQWCKSDVQLGSEESDHHLCHLWLVLQGHSSIRVCDLPMAECPCLSH